MFLFSDFDFILFLLLFGFLEAAACSGKEEKYTSYSLVFDCVSTP